MHLDESHISTSHRLATKPDSKKPLPIIVRFANRERKMKFFEKNTSIKFDA